jgi:DNA polymerase Pol2
MSEVAIIGAGFAGMSAALALADRGVKVHLIDRKVAMGGYFPLLDNQFPTNSCGVCFLSPEPPAFCPFIECNLRENINFIGNAFVENILGEDGNFLINLKINANPVNNDLCIDCGKCEEVCEVEVPHEFGEGVEKRKAVTYKGAFVLEPKPGLYENIVVLDFRSLYPSIIIRYNISFDTLKCEHEECKEKNSIEIETSLGKSIVWFCIKRKGFIPTILSEIFEERALLKKKLKTSDENSEEYRVLYAKQYALKILANATYGYLGFPNSRWYSLECAAAITALGRKSIHFVLEEAQKKGLKPIYGDTDSVFLLYPSKDTVYEFLDEINNKLGKPMELELEDFYLRGIFVPKREEKEGAKKKYALLSESGKIKLRGFETVRRDWAPIAKEVQENVINMILRENDKNKVLNYVREIIQKIKKKELPLEKFILREQLRKDLSEYKAEGPHVYAAKKYKQKGYDVRAGFIVEYVISSGGEKIRDKVKLPEECKKNDYDPEYYIDRQVIPAIERILNAIGITKEQVVGEQRSILSFFKR